MRLQDKKQKSKKIAFRLENICAPNSETTKSISRDRKSKLGQFMTSPSIANFMASLFSENGFKSCKLLDPGAGVGCLSASFIDRWLLKNFSFNKLGLTAVEIDRKIYTELTTSLNNYKNKKNISINFDLCDFIEKAVKEYIPNNQFFTHVILNPPYKKIVCESKHRTLLRKVGIETVNLYSAFVGLSLLLLEPNGQLVAIIPRSFCNGPYYKPFRDLIFKSWSIKHIHLFDSRNKAFKNDNVLQENVIIMLERKKQQNTVTISTSTDDSFSDYNTNEFHFSRIVNENDTEKFIHIPTTKIKSILEQSSKVSYSLAVLDIQVSTGPVVDFRIREHLRMVPESNTVPLLYSAHFAKMNVKWPNLDSKKANAIAKNSIIDTLLYPSGFYTVTKRFSSKEEKKRIVASIVDPTSLPDTKIGFENHLNVFHSQKQGLPENLARGLSIFLNSTHVDNHFRQFNGHTQVNATDLRLMKYPSRDILCELGAWSKKQKEINQIKIDNKIESIL